MKLKLLIALILVGLGTLLLYFNNNPAPKKLNANPTIHASFYPIAFFAKQIADNIKVVNLAGASDVHEHQLSPQDIKELYDSDLVIYHGNIEPWSKGLIPQLQSKGVVTLSAVKNIEMLPFDKSHEEGEHEEEGGHHDEDKHEEEEHHEDENSDKHTGLGHNHEHGEKHDEEDKHNHGDFDPHIWLDPVLAKTIAQNIYDAITKRFPHKQNYQSNFQELIKRLDAVHQSYQQKLANCQKRKVITSHDAYSYLGKRYNFELLPVSGISTLDTPSAQTLARLKHLADEENIGYILSEENSSQRFAETLAKESNLNILVINPLGKALLNSEKDFFEVMDDNLEKFAIALDCQ